MSGSDDASPSDRIGEPGHWRKANARLREERELSKAREKTAQRGVGQLARVAQAAAKRHQGNAHAQVNIVLRGAKITAATGRRRIVSEKRRSDLGDFFHQAINELKELRINLQNVTDFGQKHFLALVRSWEDKQLRESTIQERVCLLRRFLCLIGKPNVIPLGRTLRTLLQQHGIAAGTRGRTYIPDLPKGWKDKGIDIDAAIGAVEGADRIGGVLLKLMHRFGLRFSEAIQLQPTMSRHEGHLFVWRGTKGGKERSIPFSSDPHLAQLQRSALDEAVTIASAHPKGELGWKGLSLEQGKSRMRALLRKAGITRSGLGVTPHGLRHQYATDLFQQLTGLPAPVLQKLPSDAYWQEHEKVSAAYLEISRRMGHERPSITQSYGGSVRKLDGRDFQLRILLGKLQAASAVFHAARVREAWITGDHARGSCVAHASVLTVTVVCDGPGAMAAPVLDVLQAALENACGLKVSLEFWTDGGRPSPGVEILLARTAVAAADGELGQGMSLCGTRM